jgi:hypothetical protein
MTVAERLSIEALTSAMAFSEYLTGRKGVMSTSDLRVSSQNGMAIINDFMRTTEPELYSKIRYLNGDFFGVQHLNGHRIRLSLGSVLEIENASGYSGVTYVPVGKAIIEECPIHKRGDAMITNAKQIAITEGKTILREVRDYSIGGIAGFSWMKGASV